MTDKQINQRIAEACGWVPDCDGGICWDQYGSPLITPPNYCTDLNAMHEAENCLSLDDRNHYIDALGTIYKGSWEFATATARQRAEAFLRTIGKWEKAQK